MTDSRENNVAKMEHNVNKAWATTEEQCLQSQEIFQRVLEEYEVLVRLAKINGLPFAGSLLSYAMAKITTEAVRHNIMPEQNLEDM